MGILDSLKLDTIKAWFRTEAEELTTAARDLEDRIDQGLTEREQRLEETPSEAMDRLRQEIDDHESSFDAIRDHLNPDQ